MSDEQAAQILTVGAAVDFVLAHEPTGRCRARLARPRDDDAAGRPARGAAGGPGAPGLHARLLERAPRRLLHAAGVPRRQRAGAGGDGLPLPAPGGRALRRRAADEDPRAGGLGGLLPRGGRAPGAARAAARGGAGRGARERGGAGRDRARAGVGDRGGDRRLLPARRLRAHGRGGRGGVRAGDRGRAGATPSTSSRRCRSCWPGAARRSATR